MCNASNDGDIHQKTSIRRNNEKTSKKQKVLEVKHEKKMNHEKTQKEKGDNIFGKLSNLYKGLLWILTTNLNKHNNNVNKKHKKNALIGVVDSCNEECRKKVIKKHIINKKKDFNGDRKRKT